MSENADLTRESYALRYHIGRTLLLVGTLFAIAAAALYEAVVLGRLGENVVLSKANALEAAGVLGLLAAPLVFLAILWEVRTFPVAMTFGVLGFILSTMAAAAFSASYPERFNVWDTGPSTSTMLVVNLYGLGILLLFVGLFVGQSQRHARLKTLASALAQPRLEPPEAKPTLPALPSPIDGGFSQPQRETPMSPGGFHGEVEAIGDLQGLGADDARRLRNIGITNTAQLLGRSGDEIADGAGVPEAAVREWHGMADLLRVRGIGPAYAKLLYDSGIQTVEDLAEETPHDIVAKTSRYITSHGSAQAAGRLERRRTAAWVKEARHLLTERPARKRRPPPTRTRSRRPSTRGRSSSRRT